MATNPILDIPIRQRESTNVPLPFEMMYKVLSDRQQRYDDVEKYEREQKSQISKVSSPITAYNKYLQDKKQTYLQEALTLHNSIPDKGSSLYKRKLDELTDSWNADSTIQVIDRSNQEWTKRLDVMKELVTKGLYSSVQDVDKNFTGLDANGNIIPYTFIGIKPKPDYMTTIKNAASLVETTKKINSFVDRKRNKKITVVQEGKDPNKILTEIKAALTPEMELEIKDNKNIQSDKEYDDFLIAQSTSLGGFTISNQEEEDFTAANYDLNVRQLALQEQKLKEEIAKDKAGSSGFSGVNIAPTNVPNTGWSEKTASDVDDNGNIVPGFWGSEKDVIESNPTIKEIAKNNLFTNVWRAKQGLKPIPLQEVLKRWKNSAYKSVEKQQINTNSKDLEDAYNLLMSQRGDARIWDISTGEVSEIVDANARTEAFKAFDNNKKTEAKGFFSGRYHPANPYGPRAYEIVVGDKKYVLSLPATSDYQGAVDSQENKVFQGFSNYSPVSFGPGEYQDVTLTSQGALKPGQIYKTPVDVYFPNPDNMYHRIVVPRK
jgi:hypothetical protein